MAVYSGSILPFSDAKAKASANFGEYNGKEIKRWFCALAWLVICSFLMICVQVTSDGLYARLTKSRADFNTRNNGIYDLIVDGLPNLGPHLILNPDFMLNTFLLISVAAAIRCWSLIQLVRKSRRFLWLYGAGYLLRMITLSFTILPPSDPICIPIHRDAWGSLIMALKLLVGRGRTCTDKLFSGHTVLGTLLFWFWWEGREEFGDLNCKSPWRLYAWIHLTAMATTSTMGRHHYTVDIILSFLINTLTYWLYRCLVNIATTMSIIGKSKIESPLIWGAELVSWCEGLDLLDTPERNDYCTVDQLNLLPKIDTVPISIKVLN